MEDEPSSGKSIVYEISAEDGFRAESSDLTNLWHKVFEAVVEARLQHGLEPGTTSNPIDRTGEQMMGLAHRALAYLVEQLPGAKATEKYNFKYHKLREEGGIAGPLPINGTGCARTEGYKGRKPFDMFSWLASKYRSLPIPTLNQGSGTAAEHKIQLSTNRRATQLDLPMAMRFRHLAKSAKEAVDVFKSSIHGRGLICKREIQVSYGMTVDPEPMASHF